MSPNPPLRLFALAQVALTHSRAFMLLGVLLLSGALLPLGAGVARAESDAELLRRIEDYLNAITTLSANFLQVNHDGSISEGEIAIARPGLMRIDYAPPMQVEIISDGRWLTYIDRELGQVSQAPLNGTHAELLVRGDLRLGDDITATAIERDAGAVVITLTRTANPGEGTLTLVFVDNPLELRQWAVVDTQGLTTRVTLFDTQFDVALDPAMFEGPAPFPEGEKR